MQLPSKSAVVILLLALAAPLTATAANADWPQWRGPDRSGVSAETGLLPAWPAGGPPRRWIFRNAGQGYSGPAIVGDTLYTLGTRDRREILLALDASTGRERWAVPLGGILQNDWGDGPRGTPSVDGDRVYALTGTGVLICANVADGGIRWRVTMEALGGDVPNWGYTESVLVDGDVVVCTPGGRRGAIAALDKLTGKVRWQSRQFTADAQYSSIVPARMNGVAQYVQRTERSVVGVAADDGRLLWETEFNGRTAVIPTPIVRGNEVYVTAGYGAGCKLVRIGARNQVTTVYENKVMKNHHGGVVLVGDHLYGHGDLGWVCQDFRTGAEVWSQRRVEKGAIGYADGRIYCLEENSGTVVLAEASPRGWREHGRFTLEPQSRIRSPEGGIWTHPVISNGHLYLRDQDLIYCYDVRAK